MISRISGLILALCTLLQIVTAEELVIKNVTVVSAEREEPLKHADVVITDGLISEVSIKPVGTKGAQIIDGEGLFLTPGLMDSHVHLRAMPGIIENPSIPEHLQPLQRLFSENQPKAYLYYGVTELVDLSSSAAQLKTFKEQQWRPDVSFCGSIRVLDGYGTAGQPAETVLSWHNYILFDEEQGFNAPKGIDPADHSPEVLVKKIAEDGARCVKIFFEDGFGMASHWKVLTDSLVQRIKKAAKKFGLKVFGHANAIDMHRIAVDSQIDGIAHGMWNWNELEGQPGIPPQIALLINQVVVQDIVFQPTFNVMEGIGGVFSDEVFEDPSYKAVVPSALIKWYKTSEAKWFRHELQREVPDLSLPQLAQIFKRKGQQNGRVVKRLAELNHPLVLASDTPSSPTFAAQPGYSTYREIMQMYQAGMSLRQVFAAATLNNARAFGMTQDFGTVSPGKKANLLLLRKNPLEEIGAYDTIVKVILKGEVIERKSLGAN